MKKHIFWMALMMGLTGSLVMAKGKSSGKSKARYPRMEVVLGKVFLVSDALTVEKRAAHIQEREKALKMGDVLKDKAHLRLGVGSEAEIQLSQDSRLTLLENTEIEIPGISWENGAIFQVHLIKGAMRISCSGECVRTYSNPLYESVLPRGDFLLSYDPAIPMVGLKVLDGEASFRGFGTETELTLKAGEMATFTGVFEKGEPAFDILLKGRKVAKGHASEIQKIPADELQKWKRRDEVVKKKVKKAIEAAIVKRKKSQICDQPFGELGQCAWKCENNPKSAKDCDLQHGAVCVRTRCNANGVWSDRAELSTSQSRCQAKTVVGPCDY